MSESYKYYAFISYKSDDEKWAKRLQEQIEKFRLPAYLCKKNPERKSKINHRMKNTKDICFFTILMLLLASMISCTCKKVDGPKPIRQNIDIFSRPLQDTAIKLYLQPYNDFPEEQILKLCAVLRSNCL